MFIELVDPNPSGLQRSPMSLRDIALRWSATVEGPTRL